MSILKLRRQIIGHASERFYDKHITSAQIKALNGTPIEIVPAAAVGWHIVPTGFALYKPANTVAYDGIAAGEDLGVKYTDTNGLLVATIETTGFLDSTAAQFRWAYPYHAASGVGAGASYLPVTAEKLVIQMLVGNIATGNGTLKVRTFYQILPDTIM